MHLKQVYIHNFRKLNHCTIAFSRDKTLFVGANNSGKTSALHALNYFLTKDGSKKFAAEDIPVNLWKRLNENANKWEGADVEDASADDESRQDFISRLPRMRITLHVEKDERYLLKELIPDLTWDSTELSVDIRLEPKNWLKLKSDFMAAKEKSRRMYGETKSIGIHQLADYLQKSHFTNHLALKFYACDSAIEAFNADSLLAESAVTELFLIHTIEAQRGYSDVHDTISPKYTSLSGRFSSYIQAHTDTDILSEKNQGIIESIQHANNLLNENLNPHYIKCLSPLNRLRFPGFRNPQISLRTDIVFENLLHPSTKVLFSVPYVTESAESAYVLPDRYSGMGYRNLISITLELLSFCETWEKQFLPNDDGEEHKPALIHLVLLEEPEAHLHVQAQKAFINQALSILTPKQDNGSAIPGFAATQLVVSTHSGHIAYNHDFEKIRYFAKNVIDNIPFADVINLAEAYAGNDGPGDLRKFVSKYLKLSYYDVFFADAVILIEGKAERILMPHFMKEAGLETQYITLFEVDGNYAYIFMPLLETLGIPCLIITDIDSATQQRDGDNRKKVYTSPGEGKITLNSTLKKWVSDGAETAIDTLLNLPSERKENGSMRLCYQIGIPCEGSDNVYYPYTFEDAVAYTNKARLIATEEKFHGMVKKFINILKTKGEAPRECAEELFKAITSSGKSDFAMQMFNFSQSDQLDTPQYIAEGLNWLRNKLTTNTHYENIQ